MSTAPDVPGDPEEPRPAARPAQSWLLLGGVILVLVVIWRVTPLAKLLDRAYLADLARSIAAAPSAPALVVAAYVVLGLVLFPLTPLVAATAIIFDPARAFGVCLVGALSSAALGYAVGRLVARRRPRWVEAKRFAPLRARLQRRGLLAMAITRLLPAGNFTIANVLAGAIGIPFRDFIVGNGIGLLPGLSAFTLLAHKLRALGWLA
jgi:uncharacterized membrane protein YdjX (TVP38/TMEM64 family)